MSSETTLLSFQNERDEIRWAFATLVDEKAGLCETLKITKVTNADTYFGVLTKFSDQLRDVTKALNEETEMNLKNLSNRHRTRFDEYYEFGVPVAARTSKGDWARAIITEKIINSEVISFEVLYVDSGILNIVTKEDLSPISKKLVSRLPFQVIELKLKHVSPLDGWDEAALEVTQDLLNGESIQYQVEVAVS